MKMILAAGLLAVIVLSVMTAHALAYLYDPPADDTAYAQYKHG